jgi:hypothetical protein
MTGHQDRQHQDIRKEKFRLSFDTLLQSNDYAEETQSDVWDFAIPIQQFYQQGLNDSDLRWLVRKGWVNHAREVTIEGDQGRQFRSTGDLTFCSESCFILLQEGVLIAWEWTHSADVNRNGEIDSPPQVTDPSTSSLSAKTDSSIPTRQSDSSSPEFFMNGAENQEASEKDKLKNTNCAPANGNGHPNKNGHSEHANGNRHHNSHENDREWIVEGSNALPNWDSERRLLSLNSQVIKQFKWKALNQEMILATFEEEGWPPRIDDPLPPKPNQNSKRRLSDTIKCLNRHQKNSLVHFRGDGTGEAVIWEWMEVSHKTK